MFYQIKPGTQVKLKTREGEVIKGKVKMAINFLAPEKERGRASYVFAMQHGMQMTVSKKAVELV